MFSALRSIFSRVTGSGKVDLVSRVLRYRGGGCSSGGIQVLAALEVDDLDYQLMGADNSCASINNPGVLLGTGGIRQLRWFAIKPGSKLSGRSFGNSQSSSYDKGKTWVTESAMLEIPKPEYQASPDEVVWHHQRVTALKNAGVDTPARVAIMMEERKQKPWRPALRDGNRG